MLVRADCLGLVVAGEAIDQPGADRVDPFDAGEVEHDLLVMDRFQPVRQVADGIERQRPVETDRSSVSLYSFIEAGGCHGRDTGA
jgi:hypothetical protein